MIVTVSHLHAFFISIPSLFFSEKLSIQYVKYNASLNLRYELNFFFEINQYTRIIRVHVYKSIEFTKKRFLYLSLYSPYYAEACNELAVPISVS